MPFPLPEAPVDTVIGLYGQFNDAELSAVVASSRSALDPRDPIQHLMELREQPHFQLFEQEIGDNARPVVAYRSAVCLGATMLRRYARDTALNLSELETNPDRRYLFLGDSPLDEAYHRYGSWPIMQEDFTSPHRYRRYFQQASSVDRLKGLQASLVNNHIGFMEDASLGEREVEFGFFCRGLLDTFELYAELRHEARVAPPNQVFDPELHQKLDTDVSWAKSHPDDRTLRWRVGGLTGVYVTPGQQLRLDSRTGSMAISDDAAVLQVRRGIGGMVSASAEIDGPAIPVLFKESEEKFSLAPGDILIIRNSKGQSGVFNTLRYPFINSHDPIYPSTEVVGLAREGRVAFLFDPDIRLDTEESTLAGAMLFAKQAA